MAEKSSKKKMVAVRVYIVLSAVFILFTLYTGLKNGVYNVGFQNGLQTGQLNTLQALVIENQKTACKEPVTVTAGKDNVVQFIDIKCLQQPQGQAPVNTPTEEAAK